MNPSPHRPTLQLPRQPERTLAVATGPADDTPLASDALLRGRKAIAIAHKGATYRLQETRQGKLILTK